MKSQKMNKIVTNSFVLIAAIIGLNISAIPKTFAQQQITSWDPQQAQALLQQQQQFAPSRQPIAAELQNQVNALSAQLAAANRQLQYFQQQISLVGQQQQQQQAQPQLAQIGAQQQQHLLIAQNQPQQQQQQHHQQQLGAADVSQQLQQQQAQFQQQQQAQQQQAIEQPRVSTLVDEADIASDPRFENHQPTRVFYQQANPQAQAQHLQSAAIGHHQQQQFAHQQVGTSTTASPPSIETSLIGQQQQQQHQGAPPANMANPHNPPKNDDKFSIGLGVLSPGYTQKFGNTALDFNQDKDGFSFTLSNNGHNNQVPQVTKQTGSV